MEMVADGGYQPVEDHWQMGHFGRKEEDLLGGIVIGMQIHLEDYGGEQNC